MSQVFSADAQVNKASTPVPDGANTLLVQTNPLQPPYETCKAVVHGSCDVNLDPTTNEFTLTLFRNPASENILIAERDYSFPIGGTFGAFEVDGVDEVPDGRSVVYALMASPGGGGGTGTIDDSAFVSAMLISG